ncbi:MAG TPA: serine hydrolase domain-containing protein [Thermoanaerobaculia bacterium]
MRKAAILLLLLALPLHAQTTIEQLMKEHGIPAAGVGIIRDGELREIRVHGAPYDTVFNVASLAKPVVALVTLKLVSQGKWDLDEPLAKYWTDPDVTGDPRAAKLTTRHVLSHQTGFSNWRWLEESKKLTFHFDPGTKHQYSGEGFEYLRHALERKFKQPLDRLTKALLFEPLGMRDSRDEGPEPNAADDLLTTVEDYGRFAAWVMNGAELPAPLFADMIKPRAPFRPDAAMGLGWEVHTNLPGGEYALIHSGADKDVRALVMLFPKSKEGLVVLTNGDNGHQLYGKLVSASLTLGSEIMKRAN